MYVPEHFKMRDEQVEELLTHHGAGELITFSGEVGLSATLLPFVYQRAEDGFGSLLGHVARNNEQWRHEAVGDALVVLRGPDSYVSPTWYAAKREHGRVVPTWGRSGDRYRRCPPQSVRISPPSRPSF